MRKYINRLRYFKMVVLMTFVIYFIYLEPLYGIPTCSGVFKGCCSGYRWDEIKGVCTKCIGYLKENCTEPCPYPHYGFLCADKCNCSKEECYVSVGCADKGGKIPISGTETNVYGTNTEDIEVSSKYIDEESYLGTKQIDNSHQISNAVLVTSATEGTKPMEKRLRFYWKNPLVTIVIVAHLIVLVAVAHIGMTVIRFLRRRQHTRGCANGQVVHYQCAQENILIAGEPD